MTMIVVVVNFMTMIVVTMAVPIMVMMLMGLLDLGQQLLHHGIRLLNQLKQLAAGQLVYRCSNDGRRCIVFPQHFRCCLHLPGVRHIGAAHDDRTSVLHLVIEKFSEILHIHPAFAGIHDGYCAVQLHIQILRHVAHSIHHIRQLAHPRRLNDHPLRLVFGQHLFQGFAEIPHQGTADTT